MSQKPVKVCNLFPKLFDLAKDPLLTLKDKYALK